MSLKNRIKQLEAVIKPSDEISESCLFWWGILKKLDPGTDYAELPTDEYIQFYNEATRNNTRFIDYLIRRWHDAKDLALSAKNELRYEA